MTLLDVLKNYSKSEKQKFLQSLSKNDRLTLWHDWQFLAREDQLPPIGDWTTWLVMGGRGAGKTRTGAEWVRGMALGLH